MIAIIHTLILLARVHTTWPDAPISLALPVVAAAVDVGDETGLPPEVLVAIAQHESDFQPTAVSWRQVGDGRRLDRLAIPDVLPRGAVCGVLQSMAVTRLGCIEAMTPIGGMRAGARELVEWLDACHGDLRCALVGYAGGNRAVLMLRAGTLPRRNFADLFLAHARRLGWNPHTKAST